MAEKKIKGKTYKIGEVLATDAIRLQAKLLKVVGTGVERLPTIFAGYGKDKSPEAKEKSNGAAVAAFTDIFVKGDPDEMTNLVKQIVEMAQVKRDSGVYEDVDMDGDFTGNLSGMMELVVFVLKETYGDFFRGVLANGNLKKVAAQVSQG